MRSGHDVVTVLYDADCGVCRHTARTLRTLDARHRLRFTPLQDFTDTSIGDPEPIELLARLHVRDERGRWYVGGAAALRIASVVPALVPLSVIGRLPGAGAAADAAYRLVARNRHTISRWLRIDRCRFDPDPGPGLR